MRQLCHQARESDAVDTRPVAATYAIADLRGEVTFGCGVFTVERLDGSTAYLFWTGDHEPCFWDYLHELVHAPEPIDLDTGNLCSAGNAFRGGVKFQMD